MKALALAISLAQILNVDAATVANTFGPSDSYHGNGGGLVTDLWERAYSFTLDSTESYLLDRIEVAVGADSASSRLTFTLMTDAAGLPGTALETFTFSGISTTPFEGIIVSAESSTRPTLFGGQTYWLAASVVADSDVYWKLSDNRIPVAYARRFDSGDWQGISIDQGDDPRGAFRISATVVPEPSVGSIIAAAVLGLLTFRKRGLKH